MEFGERSSGANALCNECVENHLETNFVRSVDRLAMIRTLSISCGMPLLDAGGIRRDSSMHLFRSFSMVGYTQGGHCRLRLRSRVPKHAYECRIDLRDTAVIPRTALLVA